jgi:hypothetical protein
MRVLAPAWLDRLPLALPARLCTVGLRLVRLLGSLATWCKRTPGPVKVVKRLWPGVA